MNNPFLYGLGLGGIGGFGTQKPSDSNACRSWKLPSLPGSPASLPSLPSSWDKSHDPQRDPPCQKSPWRTNGVSETISIPTRPSHPGNYWHKSWSQKTDMESHPFRKKENHQAIGCKQTNRFYIILRNSSLWCLFDYFQFGVAQAWRCYVTSVPCNAEGFPAAQHAQRRRGVCRAHAPGVGLCRL